MPKPQLSNLSAQIPNLRPRNADDEALEHAVLSALDEEQSALREDMVYRAITDVELTTEDEHSFAGYMLLHAVDEHVLEERRADVIASVARTVRDLLDLNRELMTKTLLLDPRQHPLVVPAPLTWDAPSTGLIAAPMRSIQAVGTKAPKLTGATAIVAEDLFRVAALHLGVVRPGSGFTLTDAEACLAVAHHLGLKDVIRAKGRAYVHTHNGAGFPYIWGGGSALLVDLADEKPVFHFRWSGDVDYASTEGGYVVSVRHDEIDRTHIAIGYYDTALEIIPLHSALITGCLGAPEHQPAADAGAHAPSPPRSSS